ncbi:MAG: hypothetical protein ACUVRZ_03595 [Desulfobacca sp.]|uniref:hypothetical protein n=1 Tax=Desulfobacca sp. TaxID=2067990 RepID=UPI00404B24E2
MIEPLVLPLRLLAGLLAIQAVGYSLLVVLLPARAAFAPGERLALAFGLGCLGLSLWMFVLTCLGLPYSLMKLTGPWLALLLPALWLAGRRGWLRPDAGVLKDWFLTLATLGTRAGWSRGERACLLLLLLAFGFATLRAMLYPLWAWDELATWGLKAKAFYLARSLDLTGIEAHNYYPNLVPLALAFLYFWLGGVFEGLAKALFPLCGGSLIVLFYCFLRRLTVPRASALAATAFLVLNGTTFLSHLFIAYADLILAYYHLGVAGLLYLWLRNEAPAGSGMIITCLAGGMSWSKFEGWPLVLILVLTALLTLLWLRPPGYGKKTAAILLMALGGWLLALPWRQFVYLQGWEVGLDHMGGFYPEQFLLGAWLVLQALVWPPYFGILWPAVIFSCILAWRSLLTTPVLFLALLVAGNLAATVLAYAIVPTSAAEFPLYVRATVDRLLLHVAPASALIFSIPLSPATGSATAARNFI